MLRTVFFGTPEVAVPFLERLSKRSRVLGVVCQPDKPVGRGYETKPPPVKTKATALGLPLLQPASLKDKGFQSSFQDWGPVDVGLVVAYGRLIPQAVFDLPRHGLVNVHFSLLPKYRGAAPVQWALINGEAQTGVTFFRLVEALDAGPVFCQAAEPILAQDTTPALRSRLVQLALPLLDTLLQRLENETWTPDPQGKGQSPAPLLKKEDGRLLWAQLTAVEARNRVRALVEWPGAFTVLAGKRLKVVSAETRPWESGSPAQVVGLEKGKGLLIRCKKDALLLCQVQPEGGPVMSAESFWHGARLIVGATAGV